MELLLVLGIVGLRFGAPYLFKNSFSSLLDVIVFLITAGLSYWYETEVFLFLGSLFVMFHFLLIWYRPLFSIWPSGRGAVGRWVLGLLPPVSLTIIAIVLLNIASYDVVGIWVFFYILLGFLWLSVGSAVLGRCLDLMWAYDLVFLDNRAAIFPAASGFVGLALIYAGANTGDGPGWWVVFIAGFLGLGAWLLLAITLNTAGRLSERITVDRNVGCGIRFGCYLLASSLIAARASGGDWTSFYATVIEFGAGWPVLPLAFIALLIEVITRMVSCQTPAYGEPYRSGGGVALSILCGICYLVYAVAALILMPPLPVNPLYGAAG